MIPISLQGETRQEVLKASIEAIADGRQAALSIDRFIKGQNLRLGRDIDIESNQRASERKIRSGSSSSNASSGTPGALNVLRMKLKRDLRKQWRSRREEGVLRAGAAVCRPVPMISCSLTGKSQRRRSATSVLRNGEGTRSLRVSRSALPGVSSGAIRRSFLQRASRVL